MGCVLLSLMKASAALPAIRPSVVEPSENLWLFITLAALTAASAVTAGGFFAGNLGVTQAGGWLFVISAAAAWLTAGALVLEHAFGRTIIPMGRWSKKGNIPGAMDKDPIEYRPGMPGVKVGQ